MGRILYVFPHPDDESFGPGPAIARHRRRGHDVYLLTLTRGEATKQRQKLGYTKAEMAEVRYAEMQEVARVLDLTDMNVLDFPDGGLSELDPLVLEQAVEAYVRQVKPHIVVTYALHGISGHPDHVVGHGVVKRVFCALRGDAPYLKRLAFFTLSDKDSPNRQPHLKTSPEEAIDCKLSFTDEDRQRAQKALDCYATYQEVIAAHDPLAQIAPGVPYEIFQEHYFPPLNDLFAGLEISES